MWVFTRGECGGGKLGIKEGFRGPGLRGFCVLVGEPILHPQGRLLFILIVPVAVFLGVERNYFPFRFDFYAMGEEFT